MIFLCLLSYMTILEQHTAAIKQLCEQHKVRKLYAFGSVLTDKFNSNSDIDLLVDFDTISVGKYADNYFDLKFSLQGILKRSIDLLEEKALTNPYLVKSINQKRQLIYG